MTYYDYDIEKAKQILDDAGWTVGSDGKREKDGQKLEIKFLLSEGNSVHSLPYHKYHNQFQSLLAR